MAVEELDLVRKEKDQALESLQDLAKVTGRVCGGVRRVLGPDGEGAEPKVVSGRVC